VKVASSNLAAPIGAGPVVPISSASREPNCRGFARRPRAPARLYLRRGATKIIPSPRSTLFDALAERPAFLVDHIEEIAVRIGQRHEVVSFFHGSPERRPEP
jgi:hypothetical protein